jgi:phage repressor protein C with HTH and peptisase S24 domain
MSDAKSFQARFKERLEQTGISKAELARRIGETPQLVQSWLAGEYDNLPAANRLAKLADALGVNFLWLVTGKGSPESNVISMAADTTPDPNFVTVLEYKVSFGAGAEQEPSYDELEETRLAAYRKEWLDKIGINPENCKRVTVHGHSMEPLIQDGDCLLIDCSHVDHIEDGEIYAIAYDHTLMVKRLIKEFDLLIIKSDNSNYPKIELRGEEANRVRIIGRVIERSGLLIRH